MAKKKTVDETAQDELDRVEEQLRELTARRADLKRAAAREAEEARVEAQSALGEAVIAAFDVSWQEIDYAAFLELLTAQVDEVRLLCVSEKRSVKDAKKEALRCAEKARVKKVV